jgi:hypothetical protein
MRRAGKEVHLHVMRFCYWRCADISVSAALGYGSSCTANRAEAATILSHECSTHGTYKRSSVLRALTVVLICGVCYRAYAVLVCRRGKDEETNRAGASSSHKKCAPQRYQAIVAKDGADSTFSHYRSRGSYSGLDCLKLHLPDDVVMTLRMDPGLQTADF